MQQSFFEKWFNYSEPEWKTELDMLNNEDFIELGMSREKLEILMEKLSEKGVIE